ncbi:MAG TPA: DUF2752 domain-containing protein [Planctomycetota bacterium]|nr:DUF2752 domain-containing protein [Planctomycetota bacterium]
MDVGRHTRGHWLVLAGAALSLAALVLLGAWFVPASAGHGTHTQLGLPPCSFMELTALPCPGCGVTTAAALAARGEFARAFVTQPFGAALTLGMALFPAWALVQALRGRDLGERAPYWMNRFTVGAAALLALGAWIYRLIAASR